MGEDHILVVDDEKNILELVKYNLIQEGYEVSLAINGEKALKKVDDIAPDLIILDIMLPGLDGFEVCHCLQEMEKTEGIPIIFLSAKSEVEDKVKGLNLGATDYLTKPFSPRELASRVKAVSRRINQNPYHKKETLRYGKLTMDLKGYRVLINKEEIDLTNKEFNLLAYLIDKLGKVCSRDELLANVWGYENVSGIRTVDVHIRMLRKKFTQYNIESLLIKTVQGVGYKLVKNN
ncbi:response regulator transcription factor [Acetohalobium arabaticum]|uniref:Stage 0 sporulation protein A homolog n=1 Tax=Acetohalobium arabaticum (strain ATCC 49924 / DSM 5501 / Z-7288) TaxID=574087 RepID=D9QVY6_ACEAZ|nr:response regulator transcription factor [Acetohalobium arabaticum]ADL12395.1 two component transcriptional regulator, winged helix family [Acetohalobium arabaticum DSM 5501]